jgi:hypothetical protein
VNNTLRGAAQQDEVCAIAWNAVVLSRRNFFVTAVYLSMQIRASKNSGEV